VAGAAVPDVLRVLQLRAVAAGADRLPPEMLWRVVLGALVALLACCARVR